MINYFVQMDDPVEAVLSRIKGNYRRSIVARAIEDDGIENLPAELLDHSLSEELKNVLGSQHPQARGGEDLPDLEDGEVEIARMTLANSVHGEVTSLRARLEDDGSISYRMIDEYETEFDIPTQSSNVPVGTSDILAMFDDAEPSPTDTQCEVLFQSFFYTDLNGQDEGTEE
jgi:hypothetical protein